MAEPKRRYKSDLGLKAAKQSLDQIVQGGFETLIRKEELKSAREEKYLTLALDSELASQAKYKDFLINEGVSIPDQFQSSGFTSIVENATGDLGTIEMLDAALGNARTTNTALQSLVSDFRAGQKLSQSGAFMDQSYTAGEEGISKVTFSGTEFDKIFAEEKNKGLIGDKDLDVFKQGFLAGNMDVNAGMQYLKDETLLYQSNLANQKLEFDTAISMGSEYLSNAEKDISQVLERNGIPIQTLAFNASKGGDEGFDTFNESLDDLVDGKFGNLTKDGIVAKLVKQVVTKYAMSESKDTDVFGTLAEEASRTYNDYASGDADQRAIMEDTLSDYVKLGLINVVKGSDGQSRYVISDEIKKVQTGYSNLDAIYDRMGKKSSELVANMSSRGFDSSAAQTFNENIESMQDFNYSPEIDEIFVNSVDDNVVDPLKINFEDLNFSSKMEELSKEVEKNKGTKQTARELTKGVARNTVRFGGVSMEWADNSSGKDLSVYVPTETEIERIKEKFLKKQLRRLDPEIPNSFFENVPVVGLLAQFFPQGAEGVVEEYPDVQKELLNFNAWIDDINKLRNLRGEMEVSKLKIAEMTD